MIPKTQAWTHRYCRKLARAMGHLAPNLECPQNPCPGAKIVPRFSSITHPDIINEVALITWVSVCGAILPLPSANHTHTHTCTYNTPHYLPEAAVLQWIMDRDLIKTPTHHSEAVPVSPPDPPKAPANALTKRCTLPATIEKCKVNWLGVEEAADKKAMIW